MKFESLMQIDVQLGPFLDIGEVPGGYRRVIPIIGGSFNGPDMKGTILPGGADWNLVRPDGTVYLWARYTLQTDDGTLIMITNDGLQPGSPEIMDRILKGQPIAVDQWYARTNPRFEVASGSCYDYLNQHMYVGDLLQPTGPDSVSIQVSQVL